MDSARKVAFLDGFDILFEKRFSNVAEQGLKMCYAGNPSKLKRRDTNPMKVKELLEKLRGFDPDKDVIFYCGEVGVVPHGQGFRLFEIASVDLKEAEKTRSKDGVPSLKFIKTERSVPHVLIEIISDF